MSGQIVTAAMAYADHADPATKGKLQGDAKNIGEGVTSVMNASKVVSAGNTSLVSCVFR